MPYWLTFVDHALSFQECSQLGITGSNIAQELAQLQHQLPSMYAEALETVNDAAITHAMQHYATFTAYAHSSAASNDEPLTASWLLPNLESIRKLHMTTASATASQLHEGLGSTDRRQASTEGGLHKQSEGPVDIDWDVTAEAEPSADAESGAAAESSAESASDANAAVDIDWDVVIQPNEAAAEQSQPETDAQGTDIDWDIDMTETAQENSGGATLSGVPPVDNGGNEGTDGSIKQQQWPESAVQLSQDSNSRTSLLDDLYELKSFLLQQTQELSSGELPLVPSLYYPARVLSFAKGVLQGLIVCQGNLQHLFKMYDTRLDVGIVINGWIVSLTLSVGGL